MGRSRQRRGRRWVLEVDAGTGLVLWVAWRLFERMSGVASSEACAVAAIEHFLEAESTYSLSRR